jgi:HSP20 family protein
LTDNGQNLPKKPENPVVPFIGGDLLRKIDEFFNSDFHRSLLDSMDAFFQNHPLAWGFPVDVYETETEWIVRADLPGVDKDDIHIETLGDRLRIAVINNEQLEENNEASNYYRRERRYHRAERVIPLPYTIHKPQTRASYRNGILEVRGPKYPKTRQTLDIE